MFWGDIRRSILKVAKKKYFQKVYEEIVDKKSVWAAHVG
jgi:hypothetical protein